MAKGAGTYFDARRCLREPVPQIFQAAKLLSDAVAAHLAGDATAAESLIRRADLPAVRDWVVPLLGSSKSYPERDSFVRYRAVASAPPVLPNDQRVPLRMPTRAQKDELIARQGRHCAFCGIPLIRAEVRKAFTRLYPEAVGWGATNDLCHAAFLCMWLQFDHVLPHARGGDNSLTNLVLTCSGCNYGRMSYTLEEVGLNYPNIEGTREDTEWDGLEGILQPGTFR